MMEQLKIALCRQKEYYLSQPFTAEASIDVDRIDIVLDMIAEMEAENANL